MPFQLHEYDRAFVSFVAQSAQALAMARSPMLGMIGSEEMPTTVGSHVDTGDGDGLDLPPVAVRFEMTTEVAAVRRSDVDALVTELDAASDALARELVGLVAGSLNALTNTTGNVVKGNGRPTFDVFYEMLEKLECGVDENDELQLPTIVGSPEAVRKLLEDGEGTPAQLAKLEELKQRKRAEALARRRRRRLS